MRRSLVVVVVVAVLAAACGDDSPGDVTTAGSPTSSAVSTTSSSPAVTTTTVTGGDGGVEAVGEPRTDTYETPGFPAGGTSVAFLEDVRVGAHDGFDRVVFDLDGEMPGFRIEYVDPPIREDPSDRVIDVEGAAFLRVTMTPASGVDLSGIDPEIVYEGPDRVGAAGTGAVTEVVEIGDFEAMLAWVIGLDRKVPYSFTTLTDPTRLVVDLRSAG